MSMKLSNGTILGCSVQVRWALASTTKPVHYIASALSQDSPGVPRSSENPKQLRLEFCKHNECTRAHPCAKTVFQRWSSRAVLISTRVAAKVNCSPLSV